MVKLLSKRHFRLSFEDKQLIFHVFLNLPSYKVKGASFIIYVLSTVFLFHKLLQRSAFPPYCISNLFFCLPSKVFIFIFGGFCVRNLFVDENFNDLTFQRTELYYIYWNCMCMCVRKCLLRGSMRSFVCKSKDQGSNKYWNAQISEKLPTKYDRH